ncbi:MAG: hypothetical protein H0X38_06070 [Planctomycetes bacterium]|nr:hypothetical protein [Planctomycetota bacterium]
MRLPLVLCLSSLALPALHGAELVPGLSLGGFGEAHAELANTQSGSPLHADDARNGLDETRLTFPSDADLQLTYRFEDFTLRTDILASTVPIYDTQTVLLEQAFIDYRVDSELTIRGGRFQNTWLGWEGFHTPELWRVNHSAAWDWNLQNHAAPGEVLPFLSDGAGVIYADGELPVTVEAFVVQNVLGEGLGKRGGDNGVGGSVAWAADGFGRLELGLAYDPRAALTLDGSFESVLAADLNVDVDGLQDHGWYFAAEVQAHRHPHFAVDGRLYGNDLTALGMANYAVIPGKMSVTAMVDFVERGARATDRDLTEYALAVLTRPRKQVRFNVEAFYWQERTANADAYGAAAVVLVALP